MYKVFDKVDKDMALMENPFYTETHSHFSDWFRKILVPFPPFRKRQINICFSLSILQIYQSYLKLIYVCMESWFSLFFGYSGNHQGDRDTEY